MIISQATPNQPPQSILTKHPASTTLSCVSQRPSWLSHQVRQLVIQARDNSTSMWGRKAREATRASEELVGVLADPINQDGFQCAVIDFKHRAVITHPATSAADLNGHLKPIRTGGATNIRHALELAHQLIRDHDGEHHVLSPPPVIVLFSDGEVTAGGDPIPTADEIKQTGTVIVTVAYGRKADWKMLQAIASSPQHCYRQSASGDDLRRFMASVGQTLTMTRATGMDITQTLSRL